MVLKFIKYAAAFIIKSISDVWCMWGWNDMIGSSHDQNVFIIKNRTNEWYNLTEISYHKYQYQFLLNTIRHCTKEDKTKNLSLIS